MYTFTQRQLVQLVQALQSLTDQKVLDEEESKVAKRLISKMEGLNQEGSWSQTNYMALHTSEEESKLLQTVMEGLWR